MNRIKNYRNMYKDNISDSEKYDILKLIARIEEAIELIPEQFHVSRWNQFKEK